MDAVELLNSLLRWCNRSDGAYVERVSDDAAPLPAEMTLRQAFADVGILNVVPGAVLRALSEGGGFRRVGVPFRLSDPRDSLPVELRIRDLVASVYVDAERLHAQARVLSTDEIDGLLEQRGIVYGIDSDLVASLCRPKIAMGWYDVAMGDPAIDGMDAQIHRLVDLDQAIVRPDNESKFDFHEVSRIMEVKAGTPLVEKVAIVAPHQGRDLGGNPIPAREGRDVQIRAGSNTRLSPDGKILEAAVDGYLYQQNGLVHVGQIFEVRGDLDLSVGNLCYSGDIKIYGNVNPGFHIDAGGDVWIQGQAEQAEISSKFGRIEISGAVIACQLQAATEVKLVFAHDTVIFCRGAVEIAKYLRFCTVHCRDLKLVNAGSFVQGGEVLASHSMEMDLAGSEAGTPTVLKLADPEEEKAMRDLLALAREEPRAKTLESILAPKVQNIKQRIKRGIGFRGPALDEAQETLRQYAQVSETLRGMAAKRQTLEELLRKQRAHEGEMFIRREICGGVKLTIFGRTVPLDTLNPPVRIISRGVEIEMARN